MSLAPDALAALEEQSERRHSAQVPKDVLHTAPVPFTGASDKSCEIVHSSSNVWPRAVGDPQRELIARRIMLVCSIGVSSASGLDSIGVLTGLHVAISMSMSSSAMVLRWCSTKPSSVRSMQMPSTFVASPMSLMSNRASSC